jgi:hypothetical protein
MDAFEAGTRFLRGRAEDDGVSRALMPTVVGGAAQLRQRAEAIRTIRRQGSALRGKAAFLLRAV